MWLKKKILVATDFTESAQAAADIALELAQTFRVPLVLVHAFLAPGTGYAGVLMGPAEDYARLYEQAQRESLEKERARLAAGGTEVSAMLKPGVAWEEVLSAAQQVDADLVVVGTHGRRGLPRAVLGSVAEKIVRLSPVPVLTVHARPDTRASG
jgi:nucleotide-binding universal stress UspA family protein